MGASLTIRAERALLGAMIRDLRLARELGFLERGDFSSARYGDIYAAIHQVETDGTADDQARRAAITSAIGPDRITSQHLDMLAGQCPDVTHGRVYAQMVLEARVRRLIVTHADRLSARSASLGYDTRRLVRATDERGFEQENLTLHMARVASAMRSHAATFDPATAPVISGPVHPVADTNLINSLKFWTTASAVWANAATYVAGRYCREVAEEQVLTALLQHHPGNQQILGSLTAAEFTDPGRRNIFTAIRELSRRRNPVDPLIVDWEIARSQANRLADPSRSTAIPTQPGGSADSYATRLARAREDPRRPLGTVIDTMLGGTVNYRDFMPRDLDRGYRHSIHAVENQSANRAPASCDSAPIEGPPPHPSPDTANRLPRP